MRWSPRCRLLALPLLLCALGGCQVMSRMAYSVGAFLDPAQRPCRDDVGSCALCGEPPPHAGGLEDPGLVAPAVYGCPQCGGPGGSWAGAGDLPTQVAEIRQRTAELQEQLDAVSAESADRGRSLIQTRAEFARLQNELGQVRQQLQEGEQSMRGLQTEMRQRDLERMNSLNALLNKLERLVAENQLE